MTNMIRFNLIGICTVCVVFGYVVRVCLSVCACVSVCVCMGQHYLVIGALDGSVLVTDVSLSKIN